MYLFDINKKQREIIKDIEQQFAFKADAYEYLHFDKTKLNDVDAENILESNVKAIKSSLNTQLDELADHHVARTLYGQFMKNIDLAKEIILKEIQQPKAAPFQAQPVSPQEPAKVPKTESTTQTEPATTQTELTTAQTEPATPQTGSTATETEPPATEAESKAMEIEIQNELTESFKQNAYQFLDYDPVLIIRAQARDLVHVADQNVALRWSMLLAQLSKNLQNQYLKQIQNKITQSSYEILKDIERIQAIEKKFEEAVVNPYAFLNFDKTKVTDLHAQHDLKKSVDVAKDFWKKQLQGFPDDVVLITWQSMEQKIDAAAQDILTSIQNYITSVQIEKVTKAFDIVEVLKVLVDQDRMKKIQDCIDLAAVIKQAQGIRKFK